MIPIIERRLRVEHSLPENFHFYKWECFPHNGKTIYVEYTGAIVNAVYKSGPKKGQPNFSKSTGDREFQVTMEQEARWMADYEQETGNCSSCEGKKQEWAGWSAAEWHKFRECRKCKGSGKAASLAACAGEPS